MTFPSPSETHPDFWRSLDEWAQSEEFLQHLEGEFPERARGWLEHRPNRREFLRLMAASLALAGLASCTKPPEEHIVPTTNIPEIPPGSGTRNYATAMPIAGGGLGLLVASIDGRPIKVEGNPQHPMSLGATDAFAQASLLDLYDPDRSQVVRHQNQISSWNAFVSDLKTRLASHQSRKGAGLRVLSGPILSPTLARQKEKLFEKFPEARWHEYEPITDDAVRAGALLAFEKDVRPQYRFENADIVLSIDGDFLGQGHAKLAYARRFMERRRVDSKADAKGMNRLYAVESTPTLTGAVADHRIALSPAAIESFVLILAQKLGVEGIKAPESVAGVSQAEWNALLSDLTDSSLRRVIVAGSYQPPWVQALAHAVNARISAVGQTVSYAAPLLEGPQSQIESLKGLTQNAEADGNKVETLLILESNPVFNAPADLDFAAWLEQVPVSIHFGSHVNETSALCTWHVPSAHFLEWWGDVTAQDGTVSLIQPLLAPMYNAKSAHELLNVLLDEPQKPAYETVRETWRERQGEEGFEPFWQKALHDGIVPGPERSVEKPALRSDLAQQIDRLLVERETSSDENLTVLFRPHPTLWDGRFANNGWLQELPQPFTKLTWGNAALIDHKTAEDHGLNDGDVVELAHESRSVRIPVVIVPGQAEGVVTLHFGCGQVNGRVGAAVGTDVFPLRSTDGMWSLANVELTKTGEQKQLPRTQHHFLIEGRGLIRQGTFAEFQEHPEHPPFMEAGHQSPSAESFYPDLLEGSPQWGMSINLGACIGCNACVVACQSENNIPIVGPTELLRGREMHWLRIDTYYEGERDRPQIYHQPVLCMHCEHAPCEPVCPVAATTHSSEGLNEMTYNRCIGTRYCSNNCPYKVRRFNFFDYQEAARDLPVLQLLQNPEVTVRSRGVMEKCTYCVQRISRARIQAGLENREIEDGEVVTACQAVCPTRAIVFGDKSRAENQVALEKASPLSYGLLEDLNTRPRTTYLAAVRNPHPEL